MSPAIAAHNLGARHAQRAIHVPRDGARNGIEEGGPATAGLELMRSFVDGCGAAGAGVDAGGRHVLVVDTDVGGFRAFFAKDSELFCEEEEV